MALWETQTHSQ